MNDCTSVYSNRCGDVCGTGCGKSCDDGFVCGIGDGCGNGCGSACVKCYQGYIVVAAVRISVLVPLR